MDREARVSLAANRCLYSNPIELGGVTVLRSEAAPRSAMLNQIVGLGVDEPATEDEVDAALEAIGGDVSCYVAVAHGARPSELGRWLDERGLEASWGWMAFRRGVEPVPARPTSLRLQPVGAAEATSFARIVVTGYGLPDAVVPWAAQAPDRGWDCWLALDGDKPIAAAGVFIAEGVGYLGFAATLEEHRGKGAQNALLARRIDHAGDAGCDVVITETGERRNGPPSNSYRNILRNGFVEVAVRGNSLREARVTQTP